MFVHVIKTCDVIGFPAKQFVAIGLIINVGLVVKISLR